jgi:hypothetical protein
VGGKERVAAELASEEVALPECNNQRATTRPQNASSPRITLSVAVPVPNVALCAPAATPILC